MLCPNCESENRDGAKFCDECGFPLTGAIAARAAELADAGTEVERPSTDDIHSQATQTIESVDDTPPNPETDEGPKAEEPLQEGIQAIEEEPGKEDSAEPSVQAEPNVKADATVAINPDLAGIDLIDDEYGERVVGPDYQQPEANWRDGNTMQMPRVEGEPAQRSKDFLASSTTKRKGNGKIIIGIVVAVAAIAAIIAFATYQMQLWGGKVIPDVRGMTEADATSVLESNGFTVSSMKVKSDDTEGLVLISDPTAGSRAGEGDEIVIHVATAREIPAVVGKSEADAKAAFEEAGYENVTYAKERSDEAEGTVLSVSPEAGTRAKSTIAVTVKVAEPYVVPDISALDLDGAIAAIHNAGLAYDIVYYDTNEYPDGTIIGTDPVAGTKVKHDTVVAINVARARGIQLVELAKGIITPGYEIQIDGTNYIVSSLNSTNYLGNDQVAFTVTARPYTVFFGVYVEGEPMQVSGVITFTPDNHVASIS